VDRGLSHAELQELLGAYALDAVDGDEREAVELHLLDCPRCRAEVAEHTAVASFMASGGGRAPEEVWERIAGSLEEAPPRLDLAPVVPLSGRRSVSLRVGAAAASVAAAVIGVLGFEVVHQDHRINDLARPADLVDMRSADGHLAAQAVVLRDGAGYLVNNDLPELPSDRIYQLWALVGRSRISAGVLGSRPRLAAFKVARDARGFAITEEQAGGVKSTDKPPVVLGRITGA
jgi:anti-sigma-K factor RskA/putative zinc finger protein